ncbi:hypothetical protein D3C79_1043670 [compost metagenome]
MGRHINMANHHSGNREGMFGQLEQINQRLGMQTNPANRHNTQPFRSRGGHHRAQRNPHVR